MELKANVNFDHCGAFWFWESPDNDTTEFSNGMSIYNLKSCFKPIEVNVSF